MRDNRNYRLNSFDVLVMSVIYDEFKKYAVADVRTITALACGKIPEKITQKDIDNVLFTIEKVNSKPLRIRRSVGSIDIVGQVTNIVREHGEWDLYLDGGTSSLKYLEVFKVLKDTADKGVDLLKGEEHGVTGAYT